MYEETLYAGWGDMDFNSHMGNTAYLNKSGDVRMKFFAAHNFPMREFLKLNVGPVIQTDEIVYFKEIHLLEEFRITLSMAGLSSDGSRFIMRNEFLRADGKLAARVTSAGGWLDLNKRILIEPPQQLLKAMKALHRTADFQLLDSSIN